MRCSRTPAHTRDRFTAEGQLESGQRSPDIMPLVFCVRCPHFIYNGQNNQNILWSSSCIYATDISHSQPRVLCSTQCLLTCPWVAVVTRLNQVGLHKARSPHNYARLVGARRKLLLTVVVIDPLLPSTPLAQVKSCSLAPVRGSMRTAGPV